MLYKVTTLALLAGGALIGGHSWTKGVESPMYEVSVTSDSLREPIPASPRTLTILFASDRYTPAQARAFIEIIYRESRFDPYATNPESGAYGLGQALPANKMKSAGDDWKTNPVTQLQWVADYIKSRYGNPVKALQHHNQHGWY